MCGIYGLASPDGAPLPWPELPERMGALLRHRGPDGQGVLLGAHAAVGATRLRVVDPQPRGDQPLKDPGGSVWLACNGEIYNAPELRRRFPHYPFRSRTDVEVIIPLYLERGLESIADLHGMFALALWDDARRTLVLARDRAGEKPLFYARSGGLVLFASEIQALLECPAVPRGLDQDALAGFLALGYVPQPRSMFAAVRSVAAGTALAFAPSGSRTLRYWDPAALAPTCRPPEAVEQLRELLRGAVRRQLQADVPVGVFTSGGVDSSLVTALAVEAIGPEQIHTFTARFTAPTYDESRFARGLAGRLGTRHVEVTVDQPALAHAFDTVTSRIAEPIGDPAVLPSVVLARAAREHVTVVLAGEGADELFGGYPTYLGHALAPGFTRLPAPLQAGLRGVLRLLPDSSDKVPLRWLLRRWVTEAHRPWRERHLAWLAPGMVGSSGRPPPEAAALLPNGGPQQELAAAMLLDYRTYLSDQLLVKLDRATMLAALEARAPYLDTALTRFALTLDPRLKIRGLTTKWLLKQAAGSWLPERIIHRRKRGFSVPLAGWIRVGLRDCAARVLGSAWLRRQGLVNHVYLRRLLEEHVAGRANHARALWTLIVLQRWLERWMPEVT